MQTEDTAAGRYAAAVVRQSSATVEQPDTIALLWRSHRAAAALLRDLQDTARNGGDGLTGASAFMACVNRHIEELRDAVDDVEFAENAERVMAAVFSATEAE